MTLIKKILVVRFSSIGDIVLTTPVVRCLNTQLKDTEIHFVTKEIFKNLLEHNPHIHRLHTFKDDVSEILEQLAAEKFDLIIDLHKNLRSLRLKRKMNTKTLAFNKLNLQKFIAVNFKKLSALPAIHIVDRYFQTIKSLGIVNDGKGLDYFLPEHALVNMQDLLPEGNTKYMALVIGGSYFTKQIPINRLDDICRMAKLPVVLLGGKADVSIASELKKRFPKIIDGCGNYSIDQSASIINQAEWVITSDTGMMHIASAFNKKIISIWGNTIPQFGMSPYLPNEKNMILEVSGLECRPCSKLGYHQCPLKHFKCMNDIDLSVVADLD